MYKLNVDAARKEIQQHTRKTGGGDFVDLKSGNGVFCYILPPYSEAGVPLKHVVKMWLNPIKKNHTLFDTYGEGAPADPVREVIDTYAEDPKSFRPRTLAYFNVIVIAETVGNKVTPVAPRRGVLGVPAGVGQEIFDEIIRDPSILDPTTAVAFKIEKTGEGRDTRYPVALTGSTTPKGFIPEVVNVLDENPELLEAYDSPTDLDSIWKYSEKAQDKADELAEALKTAIEEAE